MDVQKYEQMQKTLDSIQQLVVEWQNDFINVDYASSDAMCKIEHILYQHRHEVMIQAGPQE